MQPCNIRIRDESKTLQQSNLQLTNALATLVAVFPVIMKATLNFVEHGVGLK
jgi:hypothetical protein